VAATEKYPVELRCICIGVQSAAGAQVRASERCRRMSSVGTCGQVQTESVNLC
jgi:hypothetical protein